MTVTVEVLKSSGLVEEFWQTTRQYEVEGLSDEDRAQIEELIELTANESGLTSIDMMTVISKFSAGRKLLPGVFKHYVEFEKRILGPSKRESLPRSQKTPKDPSAPKPEKIAFAPIVQLDYSRYTVLSVEEVGQLVQVVSSEHPGKPDYLKWDGFMFPVPRKTRWASGDRKSKICSAFFDTLYGKQFTREEARTMTRDQVPDQWFDALWDNYTVPGGQDEYGYSIRQSPNLAETFEIVTLVLKSS